jgi:Holliday junction resolvase
MSRHNDPRESTLVRQIVAALRATPGVVVRKRHGGSWTVAGDPDLYGSYRGRHFEIEVKLRDGEVTDLQRARLRDWERAGARTGVARSVSEALAVVGIAEATR